MKVAVVFVVLAAALVPSWAAVSEECAAKPDCMLTMGKCMKPVPSLTQCYKYNQDSCCVAGHDAVIGSEYEALWASTCTREYANLEMLFCLGCNLDQGSFVDTTNKVVRVCQQFADALFDGSTTAGRTTYDNCGVLLGDNQVLLPGVAKDPSDPSKMLIQNASAFLNLKVGSKYPFRPPFFKDFQFQVVPDNHASGCFSSDAAATIVSMFVLAVVAVVATLLA